MTLTEIDESINYAKEVTIFTDGSALENSKNSPAGWGVYIPLLKKEFSKGMYGTNNVAELTAIRVALFYFRTYFEDVFKRFRKKVIYIISDSEYSIKAVCGINKVKANADTINECKKHIRSIEKEHKVKVLFIHVNSHTRGKDFMSVNNDVVDKIANTRAKEMKKMKAKTKNANVNTNVFVNDEYILKAINDSIKTSSIDAITNTDTDAETIIIADEFIRSIKGSNLRNIILRADEKIYNSSPEKINDIRNNVLNAINAFKKNNNISEDDDDITYVAQGYQNVIVSYPYKDYLLRISKFVKPYYSTKFLTNYKLLKDHNDNGFLTPSLMRFSDEEPKYLYWHVKALEPIMNYDILKLKACMRKVLTFVSDMSIDASYFDYKYANVMNDTSKDEYVFCDFDIQRKTNVIVKLQEEYRTSDECKYLIDNYNVNNMRQFIGREISYFNTGHDFVVNAMLSYFKVDNITGRLDITALKEGFNPALLFGMIHARIFAIKIAYDERTGNKDYDESFVVNEWVIENALNMKSTNVDDVLNVH